MVSSREFTYPHRVSARLVCCLCDVLFRSCLLFDHTLTGVCTLHEYQSCKYMYIQTFYEYLVSFLCIFDQTDLYRFQVRLELNGANARLIV